MTTYSFKNLPKPHKTGLNYPVIMMKKDKENILALNMRLINVSNAHNMLRRDYRRSEIMNAITTFVILVILFLILRRI